MRRLPSMDFEPMRRACLPALMVAVGLWLAACKDEQEAPKAAVVQPEAGFRDNPDFGSVQSVAVEAEGIGQTPGIAALRALDQAIAQVNGRRVTSASEAVSAGAAINVEGLGSLDVDSDAYAEHVVSSSDGAVRSFKIVSSEEVERVEAERTFAAQMGSGGWLGDSLKVDETERTVDRFWKVKVKAEVAKFVGPKDDGRPSIVVAAPRLSSDTFVVGDARVDGGAVGAEIRARLSDALTQTERFQVLDREFGDELQAEVDFINSGNARNEEVARLGQRLATDLILVPTVEHFAYPRSARRLRMANRELVSYSGGGRVSLKLINATTGEVVMSDSFAHALPPTSPSTLPRSVDGVGMAAQMMDSLSGQMSKAVVNEIFPISVIALSGNQAVLSQGGKSVAVGERYDSVLLGQALKDPQTGRSLGRMEVPCCVLRIDRVADKTAYATIEGDLPAQLRAFKPSQVELRGLAANAETISAETPEQAAAPRVSVAAKPAAKRQSATRAAAPAADADEDW